MPFKDFLRSTRKLLRWVLSLCLSPVIMALRAIIKSLDYAATELEKI
jgi:hypothetical protein